MKKLILSIVAASAVVFTGCGNDGSDAGAALTGAIVVTENSEYVGGVASTGIYDAGAFLYSNDGKIVGFVDIDGMVYETDNDRICGGGLYGICNADAEFSDGILVGTCTVGSTADEERASNGIGSLSYRSMDCGDKK